MIRRNLVRAAVAIWVFVGVHLAAADRLVFTDLPDTEEWFTSQPAPGATTDQTAPRTGTTDTASSAARSSRSRASSSYARQARAPNMFGDSLGTGGQLIENDVVLFVPRGGNAPVACQCGTGDVTDIPGVGGGVLRIAENNKPIPMDRLFFSYNGFQNALSVGQPAPTDVNVNRYTVGCESTIYDGLWSVYVALPFTDELQLNSRSYTVTTGSLGNLAVFLKRLAYSEEGFAISAGLGISLPTGSDLTIQSHQFNPIRAQTDVEFLVLNNNAVHLVPYLGFLSTPSEDWFSQGFLSLDLAANGNRVDLGTPPSNVGILTPQNLLHLDVTIGRWLLQNPDASYLNGIAAVAEVHYTKTIQDTDTLIIPTNPDTGTFVNAQFGNVANRTDIVNLTAGVQLQIGGYSNLRVGYVVPVKERPYREFDSEIQVSFNRTY